MNSDQTIALCMIVKNESKVIERALDSVRDFVNLYFICDTGSTDGTVEVLEKYFAKHKLNGEVHQRPWKNFAHNRQESFDLATGKCDYIMTLDADEVFAPYLNNQVALTKKVFGLPTLTADRVEVKTVYSGIEYNRSHFFKEGLDWVWSWPVHEVCGSLQEKSSQFITDACVYPTSEGNRASDSKRYLRDALIFEEWLLDHPEDGRAWFYLAQSYRDGGEPAKGVDPLVKCLKYSAWDEELYMASLRLARYKVEAGESFKDVLYYFWDAYNCRPSRAEALHDMLHYYRATDKFKIGVVIGELALKIPYPTNDRLFVERAVYDWKIKDELAICYYWVGRVKEGYDMGMELLKDSTIPAVALERIKQNVEICENTLH